jgi:1-acyl-sn-glycerol-3-phosphate acyltransferase
MGIVDLVVFFLIIYPFGILVGLVFWSLVIDGVLEMRGWENFPKQKSRIVVVSNHPSLVEPILMLGLFFHLYWRHPLKYGPSTLADRKALEAENHTS